MIVSQNNGNNDMTEQCVAEGDINYIWQSTPALWAAIRPDYDGAPDSHCPIGFGRTKEEAAENLREQEDA